MVHNHSTLAQMSMTDAVLTSKVVKAVEAIKEYNNDPKRKTPALNFKCHSICIALASFIPKLTVVHGGYTGAKQKWHKGKLIGADLVVNDHSWLRTPRGNIIDPQPVGIIAAHPLFVIGRGKDAPYGSGLYVRGHIFKKRYKNKKVSKQTKALKRFLKTTLKK